MAADMDWERVWQGPVRKRWMFASSMETSTYIWVNYNDLTATSLEIMVSKGNHPQMALI